MKYLGFKIIELAIAGVSAFVGYLLAGKSGVISSLAVWVILQTLWPINEL